ncbi:MAG: hypothetical protein KJS83_11495, partial [Xanthomonadaceae bacterium]|nr:hypothetical protein [Xanthomonadaceae bacterium]
HQLDERETAGAAARAQARHKTDTHDSLFPRHDGLAPVEADDAGWIILPSRLLAKRPATNGMFGPMSGDSATESRGVPPLIRDSVTRSCRGFMPSFRGDPKSLPRT